MHTTTNLWKFCLNWSSKLQENNERKKITLVVYCVWFPMHIKRLWLKSFEWEVTSISKNTLLQREPFLTMFILSTALCCLLQVIPLVFGTVRLYYTKELTSCQNFISKGEKSQEIWSNVHAGWIIHNWNTQSERLYRWGDRTGIFFHSHIYYLKVKWFSKCFILSNCCSFNK